MIMIMIAIVDGHALLKLNHTLVVIQPSSTNRLMDSASLVMVSEVKATMPTPALGWRRWLDTSTR